MSFTPRPLPRKEKLPGGYRVGRIQKFTPEQMEIYQQMGQFLSPDSFLSRLAGGDQTAFEDQERPALRQFGQQQAQLANRFAGAGLGGLQSSGFRNESNQALSDFAERLQGNRMNVQNQALQNLMSYSQSLLNQNPYETFAYQKPRKKGFLEQIAGFAGPLAEKAIGRGSLDDFLQKLGDGFLKKLGFGGTPGRGM